MSWCGIMKPGEYQKKIFPGNTIAFTGILKAMIIFLMQKMYWKKEVTKF